MYAHAINLATYSIDSGDDRFFELADDTFNFMPVAIGLASANPLGPLYNVGLYLTEGFFESYYSGSVTGLTWAQAMAIDGVAYAGYYLHMYRETTDLGVTADDMKDFIDWKDWM